MGAGRLVPGVVGEMVDGASKAEAEGRAWCRLGRLHGWWRRDGEAVRRLEVGEAPLRQGAAARAGEGVLEIPVSPRGVDGVSNTVHPLGG